MTTATNSKLADQLPAFCYQTEQLRNGEQAAADAVGLTMDKLMVRAGEAIWEAVQAYRFDHLVVVAGPGNNGGDGYVVARLALIAKKPVVVYATEAKSTLAKQMREEFTAAGGVVKPLQKLPEASFSGATLVVDALLGNGLSRDVEGEFAAAISRVNEARQQGQITAVVCADVPSGLQSDSGQPLGTCFYADTTVTFIALKPGLLTGAAADYIGELKFAGLGVADEFANQQQPFAKRLSCESLADYLTPRKRTAHKGDAGTLLVLGGAPGMAGAAVLAGKAALRSGAGKVMVGCHPDSQAVIAPQQPELMVHAISDEHGLQLLLKQADTIVVGPGLGQSEWAHMIWQHAVASSKPLVVDADALRLLAQEASPPTSIWVLTPHPGEAAELLKSTTKTVSAQRWSAVNDIYQSYVSDSANAAGNSGGIVLLKGAGTVIRTQQGYAVNTSGTPAMASGGMGDVLSGIVGALLAQKFPPEQAVYLAVWLHGRAAEVAAENGERGTIASDLLDVLRILINQPNWHQ
ncbi:NAD(P)H-hydrate epimerase [Pseudidiomarina planktonica]|uniref:Bifunctional NAD(P)H-hydrate repair enzyme n=1 Tax=Pseudidiomarina planktonica TaxID=1323738 RepID=A0A1Y6EHA6_9GAMM|nr:NAD(P)H-hydrate dehydratase [Pseudidiomarina planktonica]RUO66167.1 bifunctional ADP-dependent NAD(P)H-hydrate dehydratase/NAD(P)H-hydrate epimerase [Pseudidiomarina planktonica]SMQ59972.1 NAD(P)H-hydrate epimerase [Pseudidiomarina planktonica]